MGYDRLAPEIAEESMSNSVQVTPFTPTDPAPGGSLPALGQAIPGWTPGD